MDVRDRIVQLLDAQRAKGYEKYGHTIEECPDSKYDWRLMAMEELIDLAQYQQKEIMRLEKIVHGFKSKAGNIAK